jgi:hypothetical protein
MHFDDEVVELALRMGLRVVQAQICLHELHQSSLIHGGRSMLSLQVLQEFRKCGAIAIFEGDVLVRPSKLKPAYALFSADSLG